MGEKGETTLGKSFTERFGSGGARNRGSPPAAVVGRERKERTKKEERRKKKGSCQTDIGKRVPALLMPYYITRAPVRLTPFLPMWRGPRI
jgi:hypothetical protein